MWLVFKFKGLVFSGKTIDGINVGVNLNLLLTVFIDVPMNALWCPLPLTQWIQGSCHGTADDVSQISLLLLTSGLQYSATNTVSRYQRQKVPAAGGRVCSQHVLPFRPT